MAKTNIVRVVPLVFVASLAGFVATTRLAHGARFDQGFKTPSGNIVCGYGGSHIRCDIRSGVRPLPPRPRWCDLDFGQGVEMARRGRASVICAGDTALGLDVPTLRYGRTWRRGGFTCVSRNAGLTCRNLSGRGFFLSRERTRLF